MKRFTDKQIYRANNVSIYELAKQLGYNPEKRGSNYHIKNHGGLYIDNTKNSLVQITECAVVIIQKFIIFNLTYLLILKYLSKYLLYS